MAIRNSYEPPLISYPDENGKIYTANQLANMVANGLLSQKFVAEALSINYDEELERLECEANNTATHKEATEIILAMEPI